MAGRKLHSHTRFGRPHITVAISILTLIGVGFGLASLRSLPVLAGDSQINAVICDPSVSPVFTGIGPASDSVVNTATITVQGTAETADHLDISVNSSPAASLSIGSSGQFSAPVSLIKGTNTIELDASYSCNGNHTLKTIIVTYEPTATPSSGSTTDTQLPATPTRTTTSSPTSQPTQSPLPTSSDSQPASVPDETTTPSPSSVQQHYSVGEQQKNLVGTLLATAVTWLPRLLVVAGFAMLLAPHRLFSKVSNHPKVQPIVRLTGAVLIPLGIFFVWQGIINMLRYGGFHG